jgi:hypothetical protein
LDVQTTKESLNVDLLEKVLDLILPPKNKTTDEDYGELLSQLLQFSVETPDAVKAIIERHYDTIMAKEAAEIRNFAIAATEHPLPPKLLDRIAKKVYFNHTGLTRIAMQSEFGDEWTAYQDIVLGYSYCAIGEEEWEQE